VKSKLDEAIKSIDAMVEKLDANKVPYTPGRDESWKNE
jgi:hypothetical protein